MLDIMLVRLTYLRGSRILRGNPRVLKSSEYQYKNKTKKDRDTGSFKWERRKDSHFDLGPLYSPKIHPGAVCSRVNPRGVRVGAGKRFLEGISNRGGVSSISLLRPGAVVTLVLSRW